MLNYPENELFYIAGESIKLKTCKLTLTPPTIGDIFKNQNVLGQNFESITHQFLYPKETILISSVETDEFKNIFQLSKSYEDYELMKSMMLINQETIDIILGFLNCFSNHVIKASVINGEISLYFSPSQDKLIYIDNKIYLEIKNIISDFTPNVPPPKLNPDIYDPKLQTRFRKMKLKNEITKQRSQQEKNKTAKSLGDIISSVCSLSNNINFLNIKQFTLYQIYEQFNRLILLDGTKQYNSLLSNPNYDSDKVSFNHWSKNIH